MYCGPYTQGSQEGALSFGKLPYASHEDHPPEVSPPRLQPREATPTIPSDTKTILFVGHLKPISRPFSWEPTNMMVWVVEGIEALPSRAPPLSPQYGLQGLKVPQSRGLLSILWCHTIPYYTILHSTILHGGGPHPVMAGQSRRFWTG